MINFSVNKDIFQFRYLPEYADFLLKNKLTEYVTVGIRFCREAELPILKPLSKFSEEELVAMSVDSNREILEALSKNEIAALIERNGKIWVENSMGLIDQDDVVAEDLTLIFYLRRKIFTYFLDTYTKNMVEQKFIIRELDLYTSQEELLAVNIFMQLQKQKLEKVAEELLVKTELLEETQEFVGMGSYLIDLKDRSKSVYTAHYNKILELPEGAMYDEFMNKIHPEDKSSVKKMVDNLMANGGEIEMEYRYIGKAGLKRIWCKAVVKVEHGKPALIKGVIRDITKKYNLMQQLQAQYSLNKQAQEITLLGSWSWSLSTGELVWSEEMYKIFGLEQGSPVTLAKVLEFIHPNNKEAAKKQMETITEQAEPRELIYKIIDGKGIEKIVHGKIKVEVNRNKTITRIYGTCQDITSSYLLKEVLTS